MPRDRVVFRRILGIALALTLPLFLPACSCRETVAARNEEAVLLTPHGETPFVKKRLEELQDLHIAGPMKQSEYLMAQADDLHVIIRTDYDSSIKLMVSSSRKGSSVAPAPSGDKGRFSMFSGDEPIIHHDYTTGETPLDRTEYPGSQEWFLDDLEYPQEIILDEKGYSSQGVQFYSPRRGFSSFQDYIGIDFPRFVLVGQPTDRNAIVQYNVPFEHEGSRYEIRFRSQFSKRRDCGYKIGVPGI